MLKIPENTSNYFSYSLGQDVRPSILKKAPIGQKYLYRSKARRQGLKGDTKTKQMALVSQGLFCCVLFAGVLQAMVLPLATDANLVTLVTPVFVRAAFKWKQ